MSPKRPMPNWPKSICCQESREKGLITPDLTTLFGTKAVDLADFSILTRILDGQGLTIDSGVYGSRGYDGDYMFTWIGAMTPIPHKVWAYSAISEPACNSWKSKLKTK